MPASLNAMSCDVEDWFQVGAFEGTIDRDHWPTLQSRVEANTDKVLTLFHRAGVKATFFTLGWVGQRHPNLLRRIVEQGHELASHGWDHRRVHTMDARSFRHDLARTKAVLEDATGVEVTGYRAPSFSIDWRTPWAHAELAEAGYRYSSSVAPLRHDHYGWPGTPLTAWRPRPDSDLIELPVTVVSMGKHHLATGGGFFRLLPYGWSARVVRSLDRPAVFYFHPWEVDPNQPRVAHAPWRSRLRHYSRLSAMAGKLERLLGEVRWGRTDAVVDGLRADTIPHPIAA